MDFLFTQDYWISRLLFERGLAAIYFVAFLVAFNQFPALLGEKGLLPVQNFLKRSNIKHSPSIFFWHYSDNFLKTVSIIGMVISGAFCLGLFSSVPIIVYMTGWLILWVIYQSIVNAGQRFYSFGWESMLLESAFFAAFIGPSWIEPSYITLFCIYWMVIRVELGAGLIKLRSDKCWRDLTCLIFHYETQPMPNPLSWIFHKFPKFIHKFGVLFSHFVQIVIPIFIFAPQPVRTIAAFFIIFHQLLLIISGNYSWLNWLTIIWAIPAISNNFLSPVFSFNIPTLSSSPLWFTILLILLGLLTIVLSIRPFLNLFSRRQLMNYSFNRFHLVNAYGAFGSITKERYEIVIEGTLDQFITDNTKWEEYEFRGKPGGLHRFPPQIAPYHLRIDWLMWFLPFSVAVYDNKIQNASYELWFMRFLKKLLEGEQQTLALIKNNPFKETPPNFIRAKYYLYEFTSFKEFRATKKWWKRRFIDDYIPPLTEKSIKEIYESV